MARTQKNRKRKTFRKKRKTKKRSRYPSISEGVTLEIDNVTPINLLTSAISDPYAYPQHNTITFVGHITDCPGFGQAFLQQYEWYRIAGIELSIKCKDVPRMLAIQTAPGTPATSMYESQMKTEFLLIPNRDGTTYPGTISTKDWSDARDSKHSIWIKGIKGQSTRTFRCKPNTLTMAYEGLANTGYVQKYGQWVRNNDAGVPHYTWTLMYKSQSTLRENYQFSFKYIVQYKSKNGKDYQATLEMGQPMTHPAGAVIQGYTVDDTNGTGLHVETVADDLICIWPNADADEGPTLNGYEDLDISQVP